METNQNIEKFLSGYCDTVFCNSMKIREMLIVNIPGICEELDISAKMISYGYGKKYSELLCVIIPSKKGVKIGFNHGAELPDPKGLLKGTGKISRYIEIKSEEDINSLAVKEIIANCIKYYQERINGKNNSQKTILEK